MRKRLAGTGNFVLLAVLALALTFPAIVKAEDRQGSSGWQVSFNGENIESNFTSANIGDEVNAMQPGDSVEFTITLKNGYDGQTDWYMENKVLETLEDAGDASGGAYYYLLTYTDTAGETTTLYSSEKFGGDGRIGGVGLHGATTSLDDYFYLDRMGNGDTGAVKLKVALDGETLVNNYQNTAARLQMDFAVELVQSDRQTVGEPGDSGNPGDSDSSGSRGRPVKTGDETRIMLYIWIMFISGFVCLLIGVGMARRRQEEEAAVKAADTKKRRK